MHPELQIKDVAEATGLAAGTIRMWEQRYGFPEPRRTPAGYRVYSTADVETIRRVQALKHRGLSLQAAIDRARESGGGPSDHPSIYAAVASADHGARPQVLRKSTLIALSRAIEHETLARAARPVIFGAFQREPFFRTVEPRWQRMAMQSDTCGVFADFPEVRRHGRLTELPVAPEDALGNEWAVVVDAPGYAACLLAWEQPGVTQPGDPDDETRRFEAIFTLDAGAARRAVEAAVQLAGRVDAEYAERVGELLAERPLALEQPAPALTALSNRIVAYLEEAGT